MIRPPAYIHDFDDDDDPDDELLDYPPPPPIDNSYLASPTPVIVAKVPPDLDRDAALIELGKARKCAGTLDACLAELMRGPLKKDMRKAALAWKTFATELEAVDPD